MHKLTVDLRLQASASIGCISVASCYVVPLYRPNSELVFKLRVMAVV